jgi:hypothetical protein
MKFRDRGIAASGREMMTGRIHDDDNDVLGELRDSGGIGRGPSGRVCCFWHSWFWRGWQLDEAQRVDILRRECRLCSFECCILRLRSETDVPPVRESGTVSQTVEGEMVHGDCVVGPEARDYCDWRGYYWSDRVNGCRDHHIFREYARVDCEYGGDEMIPRRQQA